MESAPAAEDGGGGGGGGSTTPRRNSRAQRAADKRREGGGGKGKGGEIVGAAPTPKKQRAVKKEKKRARNGEKSGEGGDDVEVEAEAPPSAGEALVDEDKQRATHWTDCAWFAGSGGDLAFAQWMLGRCSGVGDTRTPSSRATVERVHALYLVQKRLRLELALSSSAAAAVADQGTDDDGTDAENDDDPRSSGTDDSAWSVEAIVEDVARALQPSRLALARAKSAARKANVKFEGGLEKIVVSEVVEHATELLLSRATGGEGTKELEKWIALLSEDLDAAESNAEENGEPEGNGNAEANSSYTSKKAKKKEQRQRERGKGKDAEKTACEQTRAFLEFLSDFDAPPQEQASLPAMTEAVTTALPVWTQELQQIYDDCRINAVDEARRLEVAREIQGVLRNHVSKWRHCEVALFGSSLSHFGSKHSDMDMCLVPKPEAATNGSTRSGDESATSKQAVSSRQIRQLIKAGQTSEATASGENGNSSKDGEQVVSIEVLLDLDDHVTKSIEKLTLALNSLENDGRKDKTGDGAPTKKKENKQQKQLVFFLDQWQHLSRAIRHELEALTSDSGADSVAAYKAAAAERQAHLKALITASRRRVDDMYLLQGKLQRANCTIRLMIRGARIPIIRFTHNRTGFECDLCFENVLATRNTLLLRAYAEFDERARVLGLAVKHWAKQRGISDASMGFFSSYTFVLLSIYFLQQKSVGVLPNLQHHDLLERANQPRYVHNGVDISFCTNVQLTRDFHQQNLAKGGASSMANASVAELLAGFFRFYATSFDFARNVVTVRDPAVLSSKLAKWGPRKAKTWRMSVEDPLETSRDLGCVLQFKGQEAILREFRRANELLAEGASFAAVVCESAAAASNSPVPAAVAAAANGGKRGNGKPEERAYMITLWSEDRELTKPAIVALFKGFEASFRVGKILEKRDKNDHVGGNSPVTRRKWVVELRTKALQCPRTLAQKTRIDWEEVESKPSNGKAASKQRIGGGVVWIHHTEFNENAPCVKCFSPQHLERDCQEQEGEVYQKRHVLRVTVSGVMTRSTGNTANHQHKEKRANARQVHRHQSDEEEDQENDEDGGGHADRGDPRPSEKSSSTSGGNATGNSRNRERRRNKDAVDGNSGEHSARNKKPKVSGNVTSDSNAAFTAAVAQTKRNQNKEDGQTGNDVEAGKDSKKKKAHKWMRTGRDNTNKNKRRAASATSAKPAPTP